MIFDNVTTREKAEAYKATNDILLASLSEIRQLSKKKPDAMLTTTKVTIVNRVLFDLLAFLQQ